MIELLNDRIKKIRIEEGISQSELAEKIGIAKNTLCQYENNKANPSLEVVMRIANFFGVSTDYLLGLEDDFGTVVIQDKKNSPALTTEEKRLLTAYRKLVPNMQTYMLANMEMLAAQTAN